MSLENQTTPAPMNSSENTDIPSDSNVLLRNFIETIRALASQNDFKLISSQFDSVSHLQREIELMQKELAAQSLVNGRLASERSQLEDIRSEREREVTNLQEQEHRLRKQVAQLQEAWSKQKEDIKQLRDRSKEAGQSLKTKNERIESLEKYCKQSDGQIAALKADLGGKKAETTSLAERLNASDMRVAKLNSFAVQLSDERPEVSISRIESLWDDACRLVGKIFQGDLPDAVLQDDDAWLPLRKPDFCSHYVPLPQTNSTPAKQMRVAVLLSMIARSVDRHIFQPSYLVGDDGLREATLRQAIQNSEKESFCRAVLLSVMPEEQQSAAKERVEFVLDDIVNAVHSLLPLETRKAFELSLKEFVLKACYNWDAMRRIKQRLEPSFHLEHLEDREWHTLDYDPSIAGETEQRPAIQGGRDDELLVVFPRLYIVRKSHPPHPITAGTVLRRSQSLAATQEIERPLSDALGRSISIRSRRQRNLSISAHKNRSSEAGPFLDGETS